MTIVPVKQLPHARDMDLPAYATSQSAGMDLLAAVSEDVLLPAGQRRLIPTGLSIALPAGFEAQVRPRSGLALKHGLTILNSPGTIDADYRGEIAVILVNLGEEPFTVSRGMRIAQMIITPVVQATLQLVETLESTERGTGGFGSTGLKKAANT